MGHVSLYSTISADMLPVSVAERTRLKREIDSGSKDTSQKDGGAQPIPNKEERAVEDFEDDGKWYIGKASEDFRRRQQGEVARAAAAEDDDDPVQVSISFNIILPDFLIVNTVGTREKERGKRKGWRFWSRGLFRSCFTWWTSKGGRSRRAYRDDVIGSSLCSCCAPDLRPHTHRA